MVVSASLEYLVAESAFGAGQGVWAKSRVELPLPSASASSAALCSDIPLEPGEESEQAMPPAIASSAARVSDTPREASLGQDPPQGEWAVQRTFLCAVPLLRDRSTVIQSTTEANSRHGHNPRRYIAPELPGL